MYGQEVARLATLADGAPLFDYKSLDDHQVERQRELAKRRLFIQPPHVCNAEMWIRRGRLYGAELQPSPARFHMPNQTIAELTRCNYRLGQLHESEAPLDEMPSVGSRFSSMFHRPPLGLWENLTDQRAVVEQHVFLGITSAKHPQTGEDALFLLCEPGVPGSVVASQASDDGTEVAEKTGELRMPGVIAIPLIASAEDLCDESDHEQSRRIAELTVLARPPNAVEELKAMMMRKVPVRLAALKAKQALGMV